MKKIICDICGKEVNLEAEKKEYPHMWDGPWSINAAIVGDVNELKGHRACLQNVDNRVVIPERIKLTMIMR
jgi:hypothetical protein